MEKLRVLSLFSGCGAFEAALENLGIYHEIVGYCEIDKYAAKAYRVLHGIDEGMNFGDITKVDETELPEFDLVTFGFPCQSYSVAGKRGGIEDHRGQLFYDALRILKAKMPKYFIFENVQGLLSIDKGETIELILELLSNAGYEVTMDMLNAKDFGVAQNRLRLYGLGRRIDEL